MRAGLLLLAVPLLLTPALRAQYDAGFSHRKHLVLGVGCIDCHTKAKTSAQASDNLLPDVESCGQCHGPGTIKAPAKLTVTKFNHQLHTAIPGVGPVIAAAIQSGDYLSTPSEGLAEELRKADECTACHRGLHSSDKVSLAAFPAMADCLVCHSKIEPPFSCEKCHSGDAAALKPPSHTAEYLESHSQPGALSEERACAVCHDREFTCMGCH
jgi:hypothetical protein